MNQKVNVCSFYLKYETSNEPISHVTLIHNYILEYNLIPLNSKT